MIGSICLLAPRAFPQTASPRLLILDKAMSPWQRIVRVARPWLEAGCIVEYRRYHPYLVREDGKNYDLIQILGGRQPFLPDAKLTREDLDLLKQFHTEGKGIILSYPLAPGQEGQYDRQAMNQFLREIKANV
ncbi:MAG: hypothetical protein D6814_16920, partial [Calditrichaeota bacterium]